MLNIIIRYTIAALLLLSPAISFAVHLPATGQTGCFDGSGKSRACAGTGEDGEKQAGVAWPAPRFSDNGSGTVTDMLTGLIWSKNANAPNPTPNSCANAGQNMSWQQALDYVKCINTNSYLGSADWRLPNLNELESLVNAGASNSSSWLNGSGFTQVQSGLYWSSTNDDSDPKAVPPSELNAWDVDLVSGNLPLTSAKTALRAVWPVRGASAAPAQLWQTGQTKCFDTAGVRINPCTGTGQDAALSAGGSWPLVRFKTNAAATVAVDNLTGLVWTTNSITPGPAACANGGQPMTWQEALDHVKCLNQNAYLGIADWRLPNSKELRSLADYGAGNPALFDVNPFLGEAAKGNTFWSSTTAAATPKMAWSVSIFDGGVNGADKLNSQLLVWPVSGPDAVPPAVTANALPTMSKVATQTITGTTEAGITPVVTVSSGATVGPVIVSGTSWSCVVSNLKEGPNSIFITASDPAGNTTTLPAATITVDATPPALTLASAIRIKGSNHTVSGTVEAGVTPAVTAGTGVTTGPVTVGNGAWSCQLSGLKTGPNTITVTATDAAGNAATQTAAVSVVISDGILSGAGTVSVTDALKALRIATSLISASSDDLLHGDVAPLNAPDGKIDVADALLILKKVVGLPSF